MKMKKNDPGDVGGESRIGGKFTGSLLVPKDKMVMEMGIQRPCVHTANEVEAMIQEMSVLVLK